jgi:hypothetical protein
VAAEPLDEGHGLKISCDSEIGLSRAP